MHICFDLEFVNFIFQFLRVVKLLDGHEWKSEEHIFIVSTFMSYSGDSLFNLRLIGKC